MPTISKEKKVQTIISTFETSPGNCQDLMDALLEAYAECISKQPGFIGAGLHMNDAQTRVATYSQWNRREDYQAMLRLPEMRDRNRKVNEMCKSFEPVMYDVVDVFN